jgi:hypothetical protein
MYRLEDNLRKALREPEAPPDLASKVMDRAFPPSMPRKSWAFPLQAVAALVLIAGLISGGWHYQRNRAERMESERARDQIIQAFRLAGEQLKPFQRQLSEIQTMTISIPAGEN